MKLRAALFIMFAFISNQSAFANQCEWSKITNAERFEHGRSSAGVFEVQNDPVLFSYQVVEDSLFQDWSKEIKAKIDTDPFHILENEKSFYVPFPLDYKLFEQVIEHRLGKITSINCIESLFFSDQIKQFPLSLKTLEVPEMEVLFLKSADSKVIRIYYDSQGSVETVGANSFVEAHVAKDVRLGWRFFAHLHNHPFAFSGDYEGDHGGITLPSSSDSAMYFESKKEYSLENAWITNGISTIRLKAEEFSKLSNRNE